LAKGAAEEAVILAAGEGTRLRPITYTRPKCLVPVANRPFLGHQIDLLERAGIRRIVVVVSHLREMVEGWIDSLGETSLEISTCLQRSPRGTGDAIRSAESSVEGRFLVLNGDVLIDLESLSRLASQTTDCVTAKRVPNPKDYGVFQLDGERVTRVVEKAENPPSNLANVGCYSFDPEVFDWIDRTEPNPVRGEVEITDTIQQMIDAGRTVACLPVSEWNELGKLWDILNLNELLLERAAGGPGGEKSWIGGGSLVGDEVEIIPPVRIGRDCRIVGRSRIGPHTSIGDGCLLTDCTVEGSVLLDRCVVGQGSEIGYSVLGEGTVVEEGVVMLYRLPGESTISIEIKGVATDSARKRLGSVIGDRCRIRRGSRLEPGTTMDPATTSEGWSTRLGGSWKDIY